MPLQRAIYNTRTKELKMEDVEPDYLEKEQVRIDAYNALVPAAIDKVKLIRLLESQRKWVGVKDALVADGTSLDEFNAMPKLPFDDAVTDVIIGNLGYNLTQKKAMFRQMK